MRAGRSACSLRPAGGRPVAPRPRPTGSRRSARRCARVPGVPQSSDQKRTLSPSDAAWSDGVGSHRSCDNDESRVLESACFPAKTPGTVSGIPAITFILTGTVDRSSGAESRARRGVVRLNLIRGYFLAYVPGRLIVIPRYSLLGNFEELTRADIERQFATNLFGVMWVMRAVLPVMRKQRSGHVFNISSV